MEYARELLRLLSEWAVVAMDLMAVVVALAGSLQAFAGGARLVLAPGSATIAQVRGVWTRYARWLVAALTFQLAADIVETTIAPSYEDIAKLGAIALIRTFLNYFLERDLREMRGEEAARPGTGGE